MFHNVAIKNHLNLAYLKKKLYSIQRNICRIICVCLRFNVSPFLSRWYISIHIGQPIDMYSLWVYI